jgi:hypothetical protein
MAAFYLLEIPTAAEFKKESSNQLVLHSIYFTFFCIKQANIVSACMW